MRQESPHGDGVRRRMRSTGVERGYVTTDGIVERKRTAVPELKHGGRSEQLGDRADGECRGRRDGNASRGVGKPVSPGPDQLLIRHNADGHAWHALVRSISRKPGVEQLDRLLHSRMLGDGRLRANGGARDDQRREHMRREAAASLVRRLGHCR